MKSVAEIRTKMDELVRYYTGPAFKGLITADRGYHLVRAFDQLVGDGWFGFDKPVINFHTKGKDEIFIEVTEYPPLRYSVTITKGDCNDE